MRISSTKNQPTFGMKFIKLGKVQPLNWQQSSYTKTGVLYKEFHGTRNGLKLDTYEIHEDNGKVYKGKILSTIENIPIVTKVQELIHGKVTKERRI